MIDVDGLVRVYAGKRGRPDVTAIDRIDLAVERGEIYGVLGPVFAATRVYLGVGAFLFLAVVLTALSRTLKPTYAAES